MIGWRAKVNDSQTIDVPLKTGYATLSSFGRITKATHLVWMTCQDYPNINEKAPRIDVVRFYIGDR